MRKSHLFFLFFAFSFFGLYWFFKHYASSPLDFKQIHIEFEVLDSDFDAGLRYNIIIVNFSDSIEAKLKLTGRITTERRRIIAKRRVGEILNVIENNAVLVQDEVLTSSVKIQKSGNQWVEYQIKDVQKFETYFWSLFELND